jgi:hypothetical protein
MHSERLLDIGEARYIVLNAIFNNISVISWSSVLWVEKTEYPLKSTDLPQVTGKLYRVPIAMIGIKIHNFSGDKHWLYEIKIPSNLLVSTEILKRFLQFIDPITLWYHVPIQVDIATENILMS